MSSQAIVGLKPGTKVLLDGILHTAGEMVGDGRVYRDHKTGDERYLSGSAQRGMALEHRLVLGELPKDLSEHIARARGTTFKIFTFAERTVALRRLRYVRAMHDLPEKFRRRKFAIENCTRAVFDDMTNEIVGAPLVPEMPEAVESEPVPDRTLAQAVSDKLFETIERDTQTGTPPPPEKEPPSARSVRRWYRLYYASGQDIRVLLPLDCLKGNRDERYDDWVLESIAKVIDNAVLCPTPKTYVDTLSLACDRVKKDADGRDLPGFAQKRGGKRLLGKNLIGKLVSKIDRFEKTNRQLGIYEARRRFSVVELGPQGRGINTEWEVDHTLLDVFVIDPLSKKAFARPWLTAIIDRYTRCIVGFSLSFAPPSWVSVMDALRVAIYPKDHLIAGLNRGAFHIENTWDCAGLPDTLITDHGREFKSRSLDETLATLGVKSFQTKKRQPWLKGKIERWFGTIEEFLHSLPGTTFSKFYQREFYQSEKFAVLTIDQLNWIVAKWVIDVYHQDDHSKIPYPPAEMWRRSMEQYEPRIPPPVEFEPLMGTVVNRSLRRGGVKFLGLRWDSRAFANLRKKMPKDADVPVRIDPRDLNKAYAWDEAGSKWVVGHLKEPMEAASYSLDQWYYIDFNRKENMKEHGMSRRDAIDKAIADIDEFVEQIRQGYKETKAYKRYLEFVTGGRTAWEAVSTPIADDDDDGPMKPHSLGGAEGTSAHADTGPYRDDIHSPLAPDLPEEAEKEAAGQGGGGLDRDQPILIAPPPKAAAKREKHEPTGRSQKVTSIDREHAIEGTAGNTADADYDFADDDFSGAFTVRTQPTEQE